MFLLIPFPFFDMPLFRQLQENYKRQNGDGLSLTFLYIWLAGDLFNLAGIIMERLMFTMVNTVQITNCQAQFNFNP